MGTIFDPTIRILSKIPSVDQQMVRHLATELDNMQAMAVAGAGAAGSPTTPVFGSSPSNPKYFRLAGETNNAPMWQNAGMFWYSDNGTTLVTQIDNAGYIFNEQGSDVDFRIEGDTDTKLFFTDASTDRIGVGTLTPGGKLHVSDGNAVAAALITTDYIIVTTHSTAPGLNIVSASSDNVLDRAVFKGTRSRGTLASPTVPASGDSVLSFLGAIYDGVNVEGTAQIDFIVDGNVSSDVAPQRIAFMTSATTYANRIERLRIKSDGDVIIGATTASGQLHVDQASSTGAQPVLFLDQGDVSEQAIKISYSGADVDMILMELDVTGIPKINWDQSESLFDFSHGLAIQGASIIDVTSTEALLVRKNADGGDVLIVDTTNSRVGILIAPASPATLQVGGHLVLNDGGVVSPDLRFYEGANNFRLNFIGSTLQRLAFTPDGKFVEAYDIRDIDGFGVSNNTFEQKIRMETDTGGIQSVGSQLWTITDATDGAEHSSWRLKTVIAGLFQERLTIAGDGMIGLGTANTVPEAQVDVDQASSTGAVPVLKLDQGDASEQAILISYDAADVDMILIDVDVTGDPQFSWDESQDNFLFTKGITIGGASPTNATLLSIEDGITFKESAAPTADAGYVKIWSATDNELFFQSGDGTTHLLHGDAFSNIWFHGSTTGAMTVEVTISTQNAMTIINSFTVVGNEDDLANVIGSSANNTLTLSAIASGEYEISYHASVTATGGADKEMMVALGIVLATPKDITDVTDDTITPIVITSTAHGLEDGDMVQILGVLGNIAANGSFIVDGKTDNTFKIVALDGSATTGNGNFDAGSPTGDVTIQYPGNMIAHRMVRGADLGALSATGVHILANSDVLSLYVANLDGITNLTVAAVSLDTFRIGD